MDYLEKLDKVMGNPRDSRPYFTYSLKRDGKIIWQFGTTEDINVNDFMVEKEEKKKPKNILEENLIDVVLTNLETREQFAFFHDMKQGQRFCADIGYEIVYGEITPDGIELFVRIIEC